MISPEVRGVYVADVGDDKKLGKHRATKHCVCVSVGGGQYLLINTRQNSEYDDFKILASNYDFLDGEDRWLGCVALIARRAEKLLRKVGELNDADTKTVYEKIRASQRISADEKNRVLPELWATFKA